MVKEVSGNLIQLAIGGKFDIICQGCNCFCTMGAGIAKEIKTIFPKAYEADKATKSGDINKLGEYSQCYIKERKLQIFNLYTQYETGANFEYAAFISALRAMTSIINESSTIGLPMIGCGIGGANENIVKNIIRQELSLFNVTLVIFPQKIQTLVKIVQPTKVNNIDRREYLNC